MKAIASTLHVTPITMNRRKYKEKLNRKIGRTENETKISHALIRLWLIVLQTYIPYDWIDFDAVHCRFAAN